MSDDEAKLKVVEREVDEAAEALRKLRGLEPTPYPAQPPFCSFCGRGKNQVKVLIQGPHVQICDECVANCGDQIAADNQSGKL